MGERVIYSCDVCSEEFDPPPSPPGLNRLHGDCGVWFDFSQAGIPHLCHRCQENTTIAQARELLRLRMTGKQREAARFARQIVARFTKKGTPARARPTVRKR